MSSTTTETLWRIHVQPKRRDLDAQGHAILHDIHEMGLSHIEDVAFTRLYLLQGELDEKVVQRIAEELLADPITEDFHYETGTQRRDPKPGNDEALAEVHLKGGVMDPVANSTLTAIADMGIDTEQLAVSTARVYRLRGVKSSEELIAIARGLLFNDCIEEVYLNGFDRQDEPPTHLPVAPAQPFELKHVSIRELDDEALARLSREGHLFLSVEEMRTIRDHYRCLEREPTDLELETFAQTWSEHCVHKTLKSAVHYRGAAMPGARDGQKQTDDQTVELQYDNLLKDTIARATKELIDSKRADWCLSVFEDNAGIITFDEEYGIAFKVETHNHPSAIEPYGGSATGIGGVIRDVLGCGLGAKPIANTDVFCVGYPDFPNQALPKGVLHPRRVLKGVVSGVRDYGNRMGIPTINGAVLFNDGYLGNPLVFCGCAGLIPRDRIHKAPKPGDLIVVIGGRTGRDGIHGATFSSAELTDTHADEFSHAVQIGNAITEKKVLDVMMQARDYESGCLYTATTDCGAGGLSSAVGEMASELGAEVNLEKVPLKYAGLRYDEIWISEAQERMVLSVPPDNWETLEEICRKEDVEATVIGTFSNNGRLILRYDGKVVGDIEAEFLHEGFPSTAREATWEAPTETAPQTEGPTNEKEKLLHQLAQLNTASKEWIIRQYDHEVQGTNVIKPLVGPGEGPSDAAVVRPRLESNQAIALANGICPELSEEDPYWMAVAAIDEAFRNIICVGGNPKRTAILDNFCWGNCENPQTMGALVRACQGCYDASVIYGTPFISGKDSLNNEFAVDAADAEALAERMTLYNQRIRIPETLLISALSIVDDVEQCVTMDAKRPSINQSWFYLVASSIKRWQEIDLHQLLAMHQAVSKLIREQKVLAAHDCSDGGWPVALGEMAFAGRTGIDVASANIDDPFAPVVSGYILQVNEQQRAEVEELTEKLQNVSVIRVGQTHKKPRLAWRPGSEEGFEIELDQMSETWRSSLAW
jgi:phosphoribosylformylglycinamidine synthase